MENKRSLIENLKFDLMQIRTKIEAGDDNLPIELGLPKVLFDIENELDKGTPDKNKLEKGAFGIFTSY